MHSNGKENHKKQDPVFRGAISEITRPATIGSTGQLFAGDDVKGAGAMNPRRVNEFLEEVLQPGRGGAGKRVKSVILACTWGLHPDMVASGEVMGGN